MPHSFYTNPEYKTRQALITKENWRLGIYNFRRNLKEKRKCKRLECNKTFLSKPSASKMYCSNRCSALINNKGRKTSEITKQKISFALKNLPKSKRDVHFAKPKVVLICKECNKSFKVTPYLSVNRKYCTSKCARSCTW